jgi:3-isopropylmalate/(R)-2-methylmalate dehydratase large subunit
MRITVDGRAAPGVAAKDIVLAIIAYIGAGGATGCAVEYTGSAIKALSIEGRLTLCNMSIEAGARCGMIAPDDVTFAYLKDRPYAPSGADFDSAVEAWSTLTTDSDARFDREVSLEAANIAPIVTWGTSPEDALPIDASVPDPAREADEDRAQYLREALSYMGITPGRSSPRSRSIVCSSAPVPIPVSKTCGPRLRCLRGGPARCLAWFPPARRWSSARRRRRGSTASFARRVLNGASPVAPCASA